MIFFRLIFFYILSILFAYIVGQKGFIGNMKSKLIVTTLTDQVEANINRIYKGQ